MNGLLYKNLRQNRLYFILAFLVPLIYPLYCLAITGLNPDTFSESISMLNEGSILRLFFALTPMLIMGLSITNTLSCDETKKWAHFITSTPKGVKGQVAVRYAVIALLIAISVSFTVIFELLIGAVIRLTIDETPKLNVKILIEAGFFMLFVNAFELPFLFRFGNKRGAFIKAMMFLGLIIIAIIYMLFGPLPASLDSFTDKIFETLDNIRSGNTPHWLKVTGIVFPAVSVVLFHISYKLSCKFYLRSIDSYEK